MRQHRVDVIAAECQVVSEIHRYGGTLDLVATIDGVPSLLDFKTGRGVYPEHRIQLAAYGQAWNEAHPEAPFVTGLTMSALHPQDLESSTHRYEYNGTLTFRLVAPNH